MEHKKSWLCRIGWHRWIEIDPFNRVCVLCEKAKVFSLIYEGWIND